MTAFHSLFGELNRSDFQDWGSVSYTSFINSSQSLDDPSVKGNAPFVYTFLRGEYDVDVVDEALDEVVDEDNNPVVTELSDQAGLFLKVAWNWRDTDDVLRVTPAEQVYLFKAGQLVGVKKNHIRGKGQAINVLYTSDGNKDFNLLGWAIFYETNAAQ